MCFGILQSFISIKNIVVYFVLFICYSFSTWLSPLISFCIAERLVLLIIWVHLYLILMRHIAKTFESSNTLYQGLLPFQTSKGQYLMLAHLGLWFMYVFIEHTALLLNIFYQHPNRLLVLEPVQTAPIFILFIPQFSMLLLH